MLDRLYDHTIVRRYTMVKLGNLVLCYHRERRINIDRAMRFYGGRIEYAKRAHPEWFDDK